MFVGILFQLLHQYFYTKFYFWSFGSHTLLLSILTFGWSEMSPVWPMTGGKFVSLWSGIICTNLKLALTGDVHPGGVLNFGLGRGVPLGFLKCHPSMYPFWRKSDPSMYQKSKFFAEICAILAQISENFKKLINQSTKFAPFWRKF